MVQVKLNEQILKEELTPEQFERFKSIEKSDGLECAILDLPLLSVDSPECQSSILNMRIKALRLENGLSQNDLANILRVSQKEYWRYEQDGYNMNICKLAEIAIFYNVSIDWLSGYYPTRKTFYSDPGAYTEVNGYNLEKFKLDKQSKKNN